MLRGSERHQRKRHAPISVSRFYGFLFLIPLKLSHPKYICFLFGHSIGGAVVLKAASHPCIEGMLEGVVLTSPALRVKPAHTIVGIAPRIVTALDS
ncbi:hypothetical protein ES332_D10G180700v1 [Gossypium tomentosum]|uniref:Serine aminopeptidase S33 domain-containing protein n=1 Tax=Gossypium tomentosum TaxID=34277 RepID=A0A5D2J5U7_GOSTO|nr:hypothetical protein ES332_D10G180700v1 [Gossypium tomentosum]